MIKHIGSKRKLIGELLSTVGQLPKVETVLDLFSGTSRVGSALRPHGYQVTANDHNAYAYALAQCYVAADADRWERAASEHIDPLEPLGGSPGVLHAHLLRGSPLGTGPNIRGGQELIFVGACGGGQLPALA